MSVAVKICGINDAAAMQAAIEGGASFVGLVFYPRSPRIVTIENAKQLAALVPASILTVGLFVDPSDEDLQKVLRDVPLKMIQLHGGETPARVSEIKKLTGLPVMKAIGIAAEADIETARSYEGAADWLLLDAKPPKGMDALPGGNAMVFDWGLLHGETFAKPWMLAGGLNADNVIEALRITGAKTVDISSGVEDGPGKKSPVKIKQFLKLVQNVQ